MLAKKERLKRTDFNRFFASGKRHQHGFFTIVHAPHPEFHASVVVGKKVAQKAVTRNRLRRRLYSILRTLARSEGYTGVYIILTKKEAVQAPFKDLKEAIHHLLPRS